MPKMTIADIPSD
jgi:hypothetical protein